MKKPKSSTRKLGANSRDTARKPRPRDANFKQSRDVREDRGERQSKMAGVRRGRG
jgi:hypothetical protein